METIVYRFYSNRYIFIAGFGRTAVVFESIGYREAVEPIKKKVWMIFQTFLFIFLKYSI